MKRLLIVTDAWTPQTNGVVTTLTAVIPHLPALGFEVEVLHPGRFATVPLPSYPEIRVVRELWKVARFIRGAAPDTVHIATEGPLGLAARHWLCRRGMRFTTSLHTKFPEYVRDRVGLPLAVGYGFLRWFHRPSAAVLCTTDSHRSELEGWGLRHLVVWGRGVDTVHFRPATRAPRLRPQLLYVGRVAVEKNVEAFLTLPLDADKVVVGDGPARALLERRHPEACWLGFRHGDALAAAYADADVLVFPSRTDTFGLVMLEAMACGTPVAAFPVTGPRDVVVPGVTGALDVDLPVAVQRALVIDRQRCRDHALTQDWRQVAERLAVVLCPIEQPAAEGLAAGSRGHADVHRLPGPGALT